MKSRKPPWSHARVLKASTTLTPTLKLIWLEFRDLANQEDGVATIGAGALARRIGLSLRTVERHRAQLLDIGLLGRRDRGIGRPMAWWPILPRECQPQGSRITDDDVERFGELLDQLLGPIVDLGRPPSPHGGGLSTISLRSSALPPTQIGGGPPPTLTGV